MIEVDYCAFPRVMGYIAVRSSLSFVSISSETLSAVSARSAPASARHQPASARGGRKMPLFVILDLSSVPPNGLRTFTTTVSSPFRPVASTLVPWPSKAETCPAGVPLQQGNWRRRQEANVTDSCGTPNRPRNDMAVLRVCPGCRGLLCPTSAQAGRVVGSCVVNSTSRRHSCGCGSRDQDNATTLRPFCVCCLVATLALRGTWRQPWWLYR